MSSPQSFSKLLKEIENIPGIYGDTKISKNFIKT